MLNFATDLYLSHISLDCVIFGFHENQLRVLVLKLNKDNLWSLPGGFIKKDESLEEAANRVLKERTGMENIFLKQFKVFSDPKRSEANPIVPHLVSDGLITDEHWYAERFISVGFYALVEYSKVSPMPDVLSEKCVWKSLAEMESLMLDHNQILEKALDTLQIQLNYQPIGFNLLPEKFTMPELQKLYETILGRQLDRRNFQRKILSFDILDRLEERKVGVAHKAPYLYKFNLEKYQNALDAGLRGGW